MAKQEKTNFEDKMKLLDDIVNNLESGEVNLEDSIKEYTKAMELIQECDKELKTAEENVAKMVNKKGELEDFKAE